MHTQYEHHIWNLPELKTCSRGESSEICERDTEILQEFQTPGDALLPLIFEVPLRMITAFFWVLIYYAILKPIWKTTNNTDSLKKISQDNTLKPPTTTSYVVSGWLQGNDPPVYRQLALQVCATIHPQLKRQNIWKLFTCVIFFLHDVWKYLLSNWMHMFSQLFILLINQNKWYSMFAACHCNVTVNHTFLHHIFVRVLRIFSQIR